MRKLVTIISHIILIILILIIIFYGESTMGESEYTYIANKDFMNKLSNQLVIKRTLGILILINFLVCISYVFLYAKKYKWLYSILVIEIVLFGCAFLIFVYSFMFII